MVQALDKEDIEDMKTSGETWVIDFWAEWCGPCEQFSPIFKEVADNFEGDGVNFGKVDMEEHQELGTSMGVRALPTCMILKGGEEEARKSGAMSEQEFKDFLDDNI